MSPQLKVLSALLVFVSFSVLAAAPSTASVIHRATFEGSAVRINTSFVTESEDPVGGTRITVGQEEDMEVIGVDSQAGEASYSYENGSLVLEVDSTLPRKEHDIQVLWEAEDSIEERFPGLYNVDVGLFGFEDKDTVAVVENEDILSWYEPLRFRSQYFNDSLKFEGEGHLWLQAYISDEGKSTDNYYYFGDRNLSEAENLVPLLEHVTGTTNPHEKMPVVVLEDETYDEEFSEWSKGTYQTGGLITMRESLEGSDRIGTLLHETTHGFNSRALKWDQTETAYYDEGRAKFVELLVSEAHSSPRPEIFGEGVTFEEDGKRYKLSSRSSVDELWDYYQEDRNWITQWSPRKEEFSEVRPFGYALSELIIRKKVDEEGVGSLRDVHRDLSQVDRRVETPEEKAEIMNNFFDFRPCYRENRTEFESCLKDINNQEFDLESMDLNHTFEDTREEIEIGGRRRLEEQDITGRLSLLFENFLLNLERLFEGASIWISKRL